MILLLERFCYGPKGARGGRGTFGQIVLNDVVLYTVEQTWDGNAPFTSCLPEGDYRLVQHDSPKFGRRWHLIADGIVGLTQADGAPRYACLFHAANRASALAGCISPGVALGSLVSEWAVLDSRTALDRFEFALSSWTEHELHILPRRVEWP